MIVAEPARVEQLLVELLEVELLVDLLVVVTRGAAIQQEETKAVAHLNLIGEYCWE